MSENNTLYVRPYQAAILAEVNRNIATRALFNIAVTVALTEQKDQIQAKLIGLNRDTTLEVLPSGGTFCATICPYNDSDKGQCSKGDYSFMDEVVGKLNPYRSRIEGLITLMTGENIALDQTPETADGWADKLYGIRAGRGYRLGDIKRAKSKQRKRFARVGGLLKVAGLL